MFLSRRMNAFFTHGEAECSSPGAAAASVGRISAQIDHAFNEHQRHALGMVRLPRVRGRPGGCCRRCSTAAEAWLRERGRERMVGPVDFTMNDESGVLIEGFELRADGQAAVAPAATTSDCSRRPGSRRRWTC